jgi:hypothetical protein
MRTPLRHLTRLRHHDRNNKTRMAEVLVAVGIPHDRYTIAVHLDSHQVWVIDTANRDQPRGPYLSSRQAWAIANDLNTTNPTTTPTTQTTTTATRNGEARC